MDGGSEFILGIAVAFIIMCAIWHMGESSCQERHNVYDCEFAGFKPVEVAQ